MVTRSNFRLIPFAIGWVVVPPLKSYPERSEIAFWQRQIYSIYTSNFENK